MFSNSRMPLRGATAAFGAHRSAAEAVKRRHVYGTERVKALAHFRIRGAVNGEAGDRAQLQEALAKGGKRGVDVADDGVGFVTFEDVRGTVVFVDAVLVDQGARFLWVSGTIWAIRALNSANSSGFTASVNKQEIYGCMRNLSVEDAVSRRAG